MSLARRRFLAITAAAALTPAGAIAHVWQGRALGAEVQLTIRGSREEATGAILELRRLLGEVERLFSLYDRHSWLSRLNASGRLDRPPARFLELMQAADRAYGLTGGLFDPSVQPLWRALAEGGDTSAARAAVDWRRVRFDRDSIELGAGQALTFNGVAQGFATDLAAVALRARGLREVLVNIGEFRALGGPWRLGLSDPQHGYLGDRTLYGSAIATSSPGALSLGAHAHILHHQARPLWSTVSVEAANATLADSLSTALCMAPRAQIETLRAQPEVRRITLVDFSGDLITL